MSGNAVITIPAACSNPTKRTATIIFMEPHLGGMQLHYSRIGSSKEPERRHAASAAELATIVMTNIVFTAVAKDVLCRSLR